MKLDTLDEFQVLKNKKILVACSTGVDSMVLLNIVLKNYKKENVGVVHIHHNKREQSDQELEFIKEYCIDNQINIYIKKLEKYEGSNFQAWAREKRYDYFREIAKKYNYEYILLAHHANDNIETIIMRLIKSSSIAGYSGIESETKYKDINIIRPLLKYSKKDIYEYAKSNNIKYFEDASNETDDYTRNRIRHHVIPLLEKENPNLYEAINYYSYTIHEASKLIDKKVDEYISNNVNIYEKYIHSIKEFQLEQFRKLDNYLKEQVLFKLTKEIGLSKKQIEEIIKQIYSKKSKIVNKIANNLLIVIEYGFCKLIFNELNHEKVEIIIKEDGLYKTPYGEEIIVKNNQCTLIRSNNTYKFNSFPIVIRKKQNGDKIKTRIGTISVSDFLTNHKISYIDRFYILTLCTKENKILKILL